jgi:glycosyltransferase involved in cell wall biosynthesis
LRIAQIAPPFETVPPSHYGGTERVISTLTEELVRRGHEVTLFASADSRTSACLVPTVRKALWHQDPPYDDFSPFWAITMGEVAKRMDQFDLVHSHLDFWGFPLSCLSSVPVVTTLHGRLDLPQLQPLYRAFPDVPLVSISLAQRRPVPWANFVGNVYHGVDLDQYTPNLQGGDYLAFIGRISPEKGLDTAIRVARRVGKPLHVAARKPLPFMDDPNAQRDWEYFEGVIQPLLEYEHVTFVGEIAAREKDEFLGHAAALLFPICWPEPFGLVMIEALACGTPVLALAEGSVPEVIQHGVTGLVCQTEDELVASVSHIGELDRATCRRVAEQRFSPAVMADGYEQVYRRLVGGGALDTAAPALAEVG